MATKELSLSVSADAPSSVATTMPRADRKALGLTSLIVGLACIYLVGFAPMMTVHNAAHDTRHTSAFPCH
jgi:cobalt transporter subunit CbtB